MGLNPNAPPFLVYFASPPLDNYFYAGGVVLCNNRPYQPGRMHCTKYGGGCWCYYGSVPQASYPFHRCSHLDLPKPMVASYVPPLVEAQPRHRAVGAVVTPADVEDSSCGLQEKTSPVDAQGGSGKEASNTMNCGRVVVEEKVDDGGHCFTGRRGTRTKRRRRPRHNKSIASTGTEHGQTQCVWVPKDRNLKELDAFQEDGGGVTTVMIRNIPNRYSRKMLIQLLDKHCEEQNKNADAAEYEDDSGDSSVSQYDFLYLPIDFRSKGNLGYAFVNFTMAVGAHRLYKSMDGHIWEEFRSRKICRIRPARIQGHQALVENFKNSIFRCESEEFLPLAFSPPRRGGGATAAAADADADADPDDPNQSGSVYVIGSRRWTGPAV